MRIFVSGGCKNGKSFHAQRLAQAQTARPLYYVATMSPADSEDDERIIRHRQERAGWGFNTVEQHTRIEEILNKCDIGGSFLLDSLTALMACEMFPPDGSIDMNAAERIESGLAEVIAAVENIVIVSDYIYSDAILYDDITEHYRKSLARVDRAVAKSCELVLEVTFAGVITHRKL